MLRAAPICMCRLVGWGLACLIVATPSQTHSETRHALVIGNSAYVHTAPLANPRNDAELITSALQQVGFSVTTILDADQPTMKRALVDFGRLLRGSDTVGLFYYAGHGVQVRGENYLIPVDANIIDETEIPIDAINLNEFLATMERAQSRINVVILDACRNNPFPTSRRAATRGLARVDAPSGTFIAYATAPGQVALDGAAGNSPYTRALVDSIGEPGVSIEEVFKRTRKRVHEETHLQQTPWETSSITGEFFFIPLASSDQAGTRQSEPDHSVEIAFWNSIKDSDRPQTYRSYLDRFPNGAFAPLAKLKLEEAEEKERRDSSIGTAPQAQGITQPTLRVLDDVSQGKLNMRKGPGTSYEIIAAIPAGRVGLRLIGSCDWHPDDVSRKDRWCEFEWDGKRGWVWTGGLGIVENSGTFRVLEDVSEGKLNMRKGPSQRYEIVAAIRLEATGYV